MAKKQEKEQDKQDEVKEQPKTGNANSEPYVNEPLYVKG